MLRAQERAASALQAAQPLESADGLRVFGITGALATILWKGLALEHGSTATPSLRIAQIVVHASEAQALLFLYETASSDSNGLQLDDWAHRASSLASSSDAAVATVPCSYSPAVNQVQVLVCRL